MFSEVFLFFCYVVSNYVLVLGLERGRIKFYNIGSQEKYVSIKKPPQNVSNLRSHEFLPGKGKWSKSTLVSRSEGVLNLSFLLFCSKNFTFEYD